MRRFLPNLLRLAALVLLIAFLVQPMLFEPLLKPLVQANAPAVYNQGSLLSLTLSHLATVFTATLAATIVAVGLAILVTRPIGAEFLPLSRSLVNIGQTFPPVAVLALAVPAVGFGEKPTLIALFLYGLLPIFENAMTGLSTLPPAIVEAARGTGMTAWQRLTAQVEDLLPVERLAACQDDDGAGERSDLIEEAATPIEGQVLRGGKLRGRSPAMDAPEVAPAGDLPEDQAGGPGFLSRFHHQCLYVLLSSYQARGKRSNEVLPPLCKGREGWGRASGSFYLSTPLLTKEGSRGAPRAASCAPEIIPLTPLY